ncbi:MAG: ABC transporter permease [Propionibacteriales bacterium]|nr:ABC transporter permease [Propionibacteriales bacterium]
MVALLAMALLANQVGRLGLGRPMITAALRAVLQLAIAAVVITAALQSLVLALLVVLVMFSIATLTAARRTEVGRRWPWTALALAAGVLPVLLIIIGSGVAPLTPASIIPIGGIIIGGTMTGHSLSVRRSFAVLRDEYGRFEAGLAIGLPPREAIDLMVARHRPESLFPGLDQTRTVGVVTLPGAFIGVLLGGGSPVQAAAAQIIVLIGLLAAQALTVVVSHQLIMRGRLLPGDLLTDHRGMWR